jgi:hypothetical protein
MPEIPDCPARCRVRNGIVAVALALAILWVVGCEKPPAERPKFAYPDYRAKLSFKESFSNGLGEWLVEGDADTLAAEGTLSVASREAGSGCLLWTKREIDGDFQLEFTADFKDSAGTFGVLLCAQPNGPKHWKDLPPRSGRYEEYASGQILNYWIGFHQASPNGAPLNRAVIRKNPGAWLLAQTEPDPCAENRQYLIDVIYLGNRILFYADGRMALEVRDKGGFSPILTGGRIGFWILGIKNPFRIEIRNVQVFKLTPS